VVNNFELVNSESTGSRLGRKLGYKHMKLAGLVLIFAGVLALLKNIGVIVTWSIFWPIALIFAGMAVKHLGCCRMFMKGGRWGKGGCEGGVCEGESCEGGKCEEGECTDCKN